MSKDKRKKTKGSWWLGWVKYVFVDLDGSEREGKRFTEYEFATIGQAQRAASALAGGLAAPVPMTRTGRKYGSKNDKWHKPRFKILETGAEKADGG